MSVKAISCIILAGGRSERMGCDKAFALLCGRPLISHVLAVVGGLFKDIVIVVKNARQARLMRALTKARVIADRSRTASPIAGIRAGIAVIANDRFFLTACDMPALDAKFIRQLIELSPGQSCVVPVHPDGRLEPLAATYTKALFKHARLDSSLTVLIKNSRPRYVSAPGKIFFNINTPQDLEMFTREHA